MGAQDIDSINRQAWKSRDAQNQFAPLARWTDPGEREATAWVAHEARGKPILDLGVGGGRTTAILREISTDYVGIDYTPEMVELCRSNHPDAHIEHGDARDLSAFADGSKFLIVFSFNGIDAVDYDDRMRILREAYRVLQPGGLFVVSVHNREGPGHGETLGLGMLHLAAHPLKLGWRVLKFARFASSSFLNHRRYRLLNREFDGYSIKNAAAHNFGIVIVYTTFEEQKRQLASVGFETEIVFDNYEGRPVDETTEKKGIFWFHFVARKPPAPPTAHLS
jgi:SAM-dependent methyltransferase